MFEVTAKRGLENFVIYLNIMAFQHVASCEKCAFHIPANPEDLDKSNIVTCPRCGYSFEIDVKELRRRLGIIYEKAYGKRPDKPGNN